MPRVEQLSPLRKFMTQTIMWIVLGLTVGAAALVTRARQNHTSLELTSPVKLEGFSIRLPKGWEREDALINGNTNIIQLADPHSPIEIEITASPRRLNFFWSAPQQRFEQVVRKIPFGDQQSDLVVRYVAAQGDERLELFVSRTVGDGRVLSISCPTIESRRAERLSREIDVVTRIAATVEVSKDEIAPKDEGTSNPLQ